MEVTDSEKIEPTKERRSKHGGCQKINGVWKAKATRKIDIYFNRHFIDVFQWSAGLQIYFDWYYSTHNKSISPKYDDMPRGGRVEITDNQIDALVRYDKGVAALAVPNYISVVLEVCVINGGLEDVNDDWSKGIPLHNLKSALDVLVKHYGIR